MSKIAIRAENISKQYTIGAAQQSYGTLRDSLVAGLRKLLPRNSHIGPGQHTVLEKTIWALKDIAFEVQQGEVVGIIGRNGAGKSTLLKILSRITEPTTGYAEIHGRVGALLEVGTGFHAELTGRENIYLNGAILGMKRAEIARQFDEIVAFAEVEHFIDTPVKHYSSGMYLRLAFAVAAHLEPEILIVDEVLAVGDAVFQKKCLGKMENITQEGRTVLLVSHNMGAIENLCTSAIWIDEGHMVTHSDVVSTISSYLKSSASVSETSLNNRQNYSTGEACITDVRLLDAHGIPSDIFRMGETIVVEFDIEFYRYFDSIDLTLWIKRMDIGMKILHMVNQDCGFLFEKIQPGKRRFRVEISHCLIYPASYKISLWVGLNGGNVGLDFLEDILSFTMVQSNVTMRTSPLTYSKQAIFYMPSKWQDIT